LQPRALVLIVATLSRCGRARGDDSRAECVVGQDEVAKRRIGEALRQD
jgi:hypothetical protein